MHTAKEQKLDGGKVWEQGYGNKSELCWSCTSAQDGEHTTKATKHLVVLHPPVHWTNSSSGSLVAVSCPSSFSIKLRHVNLYRPHQKKCAQVSAINLASYLVCCKMKPCNCQLCSHASFLHTFQTWGHTHMLTLLSIPILPCTILGTFVEKP